MGTVLCFRAMFSAIHRFTLLHMSPAAADSIGMLEVRNISTPPSSHRQHPAAFIASPANPASLGSRVTTLLAENGGRKQEEGGSSRPACVVRGARVLQVGKPPLTSPPEQVPHHPSSSSTQRNASPLRSHSVGVKSTPVDWSMLLPTEAWLHTRRATGWTLANR